MKSAHFDILGVNADDPLVRRKPGGFENEKKYPPRFRFI